MYNRIDSAVLASYLRLTHPVADDFPATDFFLAVGRSVVLDFDKKVGVGKTHFVARGRTEHGQAARSISNAISIPPLCRSRYH